MPKNPEQTTKLTTKSSEPNTESFASWPKLEFSTATGDSNIHQYIKSLEEAVAANFGANYTSLMRTGRKYVPSMPSFPALSADHPDYLLNRDLRKAVINNYANELQRAESTNQKLYGIIWITLSKESKFAIERLPEWSTPAEDALVLPPQALQPQAQGAAGKNQADEAKPEAEDDDPPQRRRRNRRDSGGRGGRGRARGGAARRRQQEQEEPAGDDGRQEGPNGNPGSPLPTGLARNGATTNLFYSLSLLPSSTLSRSYGELY